MRITPEQLKGSLLEKALQSISDQAVYVAPQLGIGYVEIWQIP